MRTIFTLSFLMLIGVLHSQIAIQINTDGSTTVLHQAGSIFVGVNPDGSSAIGHLAGNMVISSNSNGTTGIGIVHGIIPDQYNVEPIDEIQHTLILWGVVEVDFQFWRKNRIFRKIIRSVLRGNFETEFQYSLIHSKQLFMIYDNL